MKKRARLLPSKNEFHPKDLISQLPDDILVSILSRLKLKEAAITGILSKRWQYLWTYVSALDFDANESLNKIASDKRSLNPERAKYISWVNRIVAKHRGATLNALKITFDLDKTSESEIEGWVRFAITKGIRRLELDLLENGELLRDPANNYILPYEYLSGCGKRLSLKNTSLHTRPRLERLEYLFLTCVTVCDEALDLLLTHCPALYHLAIHGSKNLVNVKVISSSLVLKRLEIVHCTGLESIELWNQSKLLAFTYMGSAVKLSLGNLPMLNEIAIGEGDTGLENNVLDKISCCIYQLDVLILDVFRPDDNLKSLSFPELPKLKQLILKIGAWGDDSLLQFTTLAKACPNLERFIVQLLRMNPTKRRRKIREAPKFSHKSLKYVEFYGYYGRTSDAELVLYFVENAASLREVVIDPRNQLLERAPAVAKEIKIEEAARKHAAKHLKPRIPRGVGLVVL